MDAHIPPSIVMAFQRPLPVLANVVSLLLYNICNKKAKDAFVPSLLPPLPCALLRGIYRTCKDIIEGRKFPRDGVFSALTRGRKGRMFYGTRKVSRETCINHLMTAFSHLLYKGFFQPLRHFTLQYITFWRFASVIFSGAWPGSPLCVPLSGPDAEWTYSALGSNAELI